MNMLYDVVVCSILVAHCFAHISCRLLLSYLVIGLRCDVFLSFPLSSTFWTSFHCSPFKAFPAFPLLLLVVIHYMFVSLLS